MHRFGGFVSMRSNPDGSDTPYEINITWFEAMQGTRKGPDPWQIARFLCSQAIMLSLQGIPALYIHTLTGTLNDVEGVERSGRLRSINRRRWQRRELDLLLDSTATPTHDVFNALSRLLARRREEACFHPNAAQRVVSSPRRYWPLSAAPSPTADARWRCITSRSYRWRSTSSAQTFSRRYRQRSGTTSTSRRRIHPRPRCRLTLYAGW